MAENATLKPIILDAETSVFAVLDGAQFDDLPMALFDENFVHRSLYLDRGNGTVDQLRTAPQLVWLDRDRGMQRHNADQNDGKPLFPVLERLLSLVADRPAIVFWVCEAGGEVLYRHLRGINKILLPTDAARGTSDRLEPLPSNADQPNDADHEMVLYRHCDANVMAQVLPALTLPNMARVLGPASQILCSPDDHWAERPLRLLRNPDMPIAPIGPLKLSTAEVHKIEDRREVKACQTVRGYLRRYASDVTKKFSDDELNARVWAYRNEAKRYGIRSEAAHHRWAYLQIVSGGRIADNEDFNRFMRHSNPSVSPDERIGLLMKATTAHLRRAH
jgi:hypothetical protein